MSAPPTAAAPAPAAEFRRLAGEPRRAAAVSRGRLGFAFSRRFLFLLVAGLPLLAPLVLWRSAWPFALVIWVAVLLLLWLGDLLALPNPSKLEAEREWPEPLELTEVQRYRVSLWNRSRQPLQVDLVDDIPSEFTGHEGFSTQASASLPPGQHRVLDFPLQPVKRGERRAGKLHLRYRSPLGLAERWAAADLTQPVIVYPHLREARASALHLTRSQQFSLQRRLARHGAQSRDFHHLREFRDGDEMRDICWTATARRGQPITLVRRPERSQTVWTVLDCGRLLQARVRTGRTAAGAPLLARDGLTKLDYAITAALSIAETALNLGDRAGLLTYGEHLSALTPPADGAAQLRRMVDHLARAHTEAGEAAHIRAAGRILAAQSQRALVVWLTDFSESALTPEVIQAASRISRRHLLLFVAIRQTDLAEMSNRMPQTPRDMFVGAAARQMVEYRELQLAGLRRHNAMAIEIAPAALAPAVANRYLEIKERALI